MGTLCNCGSTSCGYGIEVNLTADKVLVCRNYYIHLWHFYQKMGLSQRKMRELVIDILCYNCCVDILDQNGVRFEIPEYDDVLPQDECCTWFRRYLKTNSSGNAPKTYYDSEEYIMRLRLLDIVARLIDPDYFK